MNLIRLAIGWLIGIGLTGSFNVPLPWWLIVATVALVGLPFDRSSQRWLALSVLCCALGGVRFHVAQPLIGPQHIERWADTDHLTLVGYVAEEPRRDDRGQQLVLEVTHTRTSERFVMTEGRVLVRVPPYPPFYPGDRLWLEGDLSRPATAQRVGEFDYRAYLARRNIFVLMHRPTVIRQLDKPVTNWGIKQISQFREHCRQIILRLLPEPQAALAIGILLGIQAGLPETTRTAFAATGTSHILVVSGWNFSIAAAALAALARLLRLPPWPAFWLSLAIMWIYAGFTGASAAVIRAAMMAILALLARTADRQSEPWRLLLAACWLLTLINPQTLWDLGFQLSALATASLFAFGKPVDHWLGMIRWPCHPVVGAIREALGATLAAQVLTLPLMLYHFGNLSLIAPLANIVIVPVVPFAMLFGGCALLGGLVWLPLGQWLALGAWLPLSWINSVATLLAEPAWAVVRLPAFPLWLLIVMYVVIGGSWWRWVRDDGQVNAEAVSSSVD